MKFDETSQGLGLRGLQIAPAQAFGAVRLVPLLKEHVREDLRLGTLEFKGRRPHAVGVRGHADAPTVAYCSYIPHAYVLRWSSDGTAVAARGAALTDKQLGLRDLGGVRVLHRMVRQEEPGALRFLPLHLSLEGFLSLHFGGPDVAWSEYSRQALSHGLSPRRERAALGSHVHGLEDAVRMFEIHERQVGALVFVADALAAMVVFPHPDDYRALHRSLVRDFFGELVYQYAILYDDVPAHRVAVREAEIADLAGLRAAVARARADWTAFTAGMAAGVLREPLRWQTVHRTGPFRLRRFMSALRPDEDNHLGEAILRDGGELEYCKTFRLSAAQVRRAFLLEKLAQHHWDLARTAEALGVEVPALLVRLRNAGFGYLLKEHVLKNLPPGAV
ncbi:hypothetical protein SAMN02745121_04413 [Nannocystis exedens]|uniref:ARG and Rhodanese-Phosphatase-superfamily-associated domain-containing protein n=1 Tax=Nannocystis exedens TaxID=54 RepID=A0A1I2AW03_9BACT|nr:hypothetical protein [Nannocystis exedens]PCC74312.1 hypothetical protein NAEX_07401 [Nannocystis exedens]SFE48164.1 hypothetical protein SAMN02745121_04413 [Nannocystis exedens]